MLFIIWPLWQKGKYTSFQQNTTIFICFSLLWVHDSWYQSNACETYEYMLMKGKLVLVDLFACEQCLYSLLNIILSKNLASSWYIPVWSNKLKMKRKWIISEWKKCFIKISSSKPGICFRLFEFHLIYRNNNKDINIVIYINLFICKDKIDSKKVFFITSFLITMIHLLR